SFCPDERRQKAGRGGVRHNPDAEARSVPKRRRRGLRAEERGHEPRKSESQGSPVTRNPCPAHRTKNRRRGHPGAYLTLSLVHPRPRARASLSSGPSEPRPRLSAAATPDATPPTLMA